MQKLKDSYVLNVYKGIVKGETLLQIHKEILKDTINFKKVNGYVPESFKLQAFNYAKKVKKFEKEGISLGLVEIALLDYVFKKMNENKYMDQLNHQVYENARHVEAKQKDELIETEIKEARGNHLVFYLVSSHNDCAEDHLNWQGRIYIDENWRNVCKDEEMDMIQEYIRANGIRTFQWVIGRPVWMITRPNCRHYFKRLYTKSVMENTVPTLLAMNNMVSARGKKRNLQTIQHDLRTEWYNEENVDNIIYQYEERLSLHKKMRLIKNCPELIRAIQKDKLLIRKWKDYRRDFF